MNKNTMTMNPSAVLSGTVFIATVTVIHLVYEGVIRPAANALVSAQGAAAANDFWVVVKDLEQQAAISLGFFCIFLMLYKYIRLINEEPFYTQDFLPEHKYDKTMPLDVDAALAELEGSQYRDNSAIETWINCIQRYKNTSNVQHASDAIVSSVDNLSMQLESGNSMIRYFIWAIPSIGFVGTVRGIGGALGKAEEAVSGDISGMVDKLGMAFNSTLVSLLVSLVLMLFLHMLNKRQDEMVIRTKKSCEMHLLTHLHNRSQ
ncbi:Possible biopolymer transport protein, ExbB family [hydrothermal vent metagenome]|uniref:Possible biopolymer transport protein, ExbB family n=1 Tax=hydrothermal vent metagenome TaxID=652676 RepID=A0A3B1B842_9ZZZZ